MFLDTVSIGLSVMFVCVLLFSALLLQFVCNALFHFNQHGCVTIKYLSISISICLSFFILSTYDNRAASILYVQHVYTLTSSNYFS